MALVRRPVRLVGGDVYPAEQDAQERHLAPRGTVIEGVGLIGPSGLVVCAYH